MATATEQTFQEFLKSLAERQGGPQVRARRAEWLDSVGRLMALLTTWVQQADTDHVLEIDRREEVREEAGLGRYTVPGLAIGVGKVRAEVTPVARNVRHLPASLAFLMASQKGTEEFERWHAAGQVDVGSRFDRWNLYRVVNSSGTEEWWAFKGGATKADDRAGRLDAKVVEAILRDVLA